MYIYYLIYINIYTYNVIIRGFVWSTCDVDDPTEARDKNSEKSHLLWPCVVNILKKIWKVPFTVTLYGEYARALKFRNSFQMADVYKLLNENYVEDDDNMFRFHFFYCNPKDTKWKKCVMRTTSRTMTICLGSHRLTKKNVMNHVFLAFVQVWLFDRVPAMGPESTRLQK